MPGSETAAPLLTETKSGLSLEQNLASRLF